MEELNRDELKIIEYSMFQDLWTEFFEDIQDFIRIFKAGAIKERFLFRFILTPDKEHRYAVVKFYQETKQKSKRMIIQLFQDTEEGENFSLMICPTTITMHYFNRVSCPKGRLDLLLRRKYEQLDD